MKIEKKTWPKYLQLILEGKKSFDMRIADFDCQEGDVLVLREWDPETNEYTGRVLEKEITLATKMKDFSFWDPKEIEKYGLQIISFKDKKAKS